MFSVINSFFCSISAFFFKNIVTFLLFCLLSYFLYFYVIRKLNKTSRILFYIFVALIISSGIVLILLPSKENVMSSHVINSYYFGPVELITILLLFVSMLSSKCDNKVYNNNLEGKKVKIDNIEIKEKKPVRKKKVKIEKKEETKEIIKEKKKSPKKVTKRKTKKEK